MNIIVTVLGGIAFLVFGGLTVLIARALLKYTKANAHDNLDASEKGSR